MFDLNKQMFGVFTGLMGSVFIGYCFYFDHKRRNAPDYKKRVQETRRHRRLQTQPKTIKSHLGNLDITDQKGLHNYMLEEIQTGESLITCGRFEEGVEHLAKALIVCSQPIHLLEVMQNTLNKPIFSLLIKKLQVTQHAVQSSRNSS